MAKNNSKKNAPESKIDVLRRVGDYKAIRKITGSREGLEPNPLVFWIGIGSVALALGLTFWFLR